ncbi:MAG TPA: ABC transporter ATP-binding protein [Candidatus Polarisedimenticolia bacterium]|nr:ABC transporter ATP-binding protein [Candidatus Polarisedimenticolia bacterium]
MTERPPATLRLADVRKSYETPSGPLWVLRGITFEMKAGESLAIIGPSGAGKSTLLHLIGTLDRPTSGTIEVDGRNPHDLPEPKLAALRNRRIGFVFQDHHLLPQYSALENILLPALASRTDGGSALVRARELLSRVGLTGRADHRPSELSGGERQRAAVARAVINEPGLVLCDEPTGSLDEAAAGGVADLLLDLHAQERSILIVVTHSLSLAARFGRRFRLTEGVCSEA